MNAVYDGDLYDDDDDDDDDDAYDRMWYFC